MDLQKIINEQMGEYTKNQLADNVNKHLSVMIDSILGDLFGRYGDNRDKIRDAISEKINIDVSKLSLIDYNGMVATAIQNKFNNLALTNSVEPVMELISDVVGKKFQDDEIALEDIVEKMTEIFYENSEYGDEGKISFYAKHNDRYNWVECWADSELDKEKNDCDIRFSFSTDYSRTIGNFNMLNHRGNKTIDIAILNDVEKFLYRLWCSGTKIKVNDTDLNGEEIDFDLDVENDGD